MICNKIGIMIGVKSVFYFSNYWYFGVIEGGFVFVCGGVMG